MLIPVLIILGVLVLITFSVYFVVSCIASKNMVHSCVAPNYDTREKRKARNLKEGLSLGTENWERKEIVIPMPDGYAIHGDITINDPKKWMIFLHGHGSTREGSIKYAKVFYELGYSILIYDHRGHGDNKKHICTMGYLESQDACNVLKYVKSTYGSDIELGVFGVSMGGASSLILTSLTQEMDFVIADCPYAGLQLLLKKTCEVRKVPSILPLALSDLTLRTKYHFSMNKVSAYRKVRVNKVPILLIHGTADDKVDLRNHNKIVKNLNCYYETLLIKDAGHGESVTKEPLNYKNKIAEFINNVHKMN